ncbi:MAG: sensor histidine kinase [Chloroflexi bacterium]|nr:sensor histidine kinase [Chloroflexota bacterium]
MRAANLATTVDAANAANIAEAPRRHHSVPAIWLLGAIWQWLLRFSLFGKILIANSLIVGAGATVGTYLTTAHVKLSPHDTHYEMMVLFAAGGLAISVVVNALVLRTALLPLIRLERTARRVLDGDLDARATLGTIRDPNTDQLAATFNAMLDSLRARTQQIEAYSARLQELSDRVLIAQEEERRRLAAELHDDTGQVLSTLLLHLKLFRDAIARPDVGRDTLVAQANALTDLAREVLDGVRRLALELRPRMLDDLGLVAALHAYCEEWGARTGIHPTFRAPPPHELRLAPAAEIAVYRMVQEALTNVARHAAASNATVELIVRGGELVVEVRDDGKGMQLDGTAGRHAAPQEAGGLGAGLGLFSMQERIYLAGGAFELESAPGRGTTVRARVPLERERLGEHFEDHARSAML